MTNKPMCFLCKAPLYKAENDEYQYICTKDKAHKYQIYAEVMSYDNKFSTIYNEEEENQLELAVLEGAGSPIRMVANDSNLDSNLSILDREKGSKSDIKRPKYMLDSDKTKVIEYRE